RLSRVYMITTNSLYACLGIAFIAFGLIGMRDGFAGATLFPVHIFKYLAILGAIVCVASIIGIIGTYVKKPTITYVYMIIIVAALVFQVIIGVRIYQKAANASKYLSDLWPTASANYRLNLQNQFNCCGYQTTNDNFVLSNECQPLSTTLTNISPPCAPALQNYVKYTFAKVYYTVFAALALELLAMSNAITLLCTGSGSYIGEDEEEERRKRRKSGIRLDDMTVDTPTTLVGSPQDEHKFYSYGDEAAIRNDRYDSYDVYRNGTHDYPYHNDNSYSSNN
ncbi:Tetraspanin family-domain-containing protein, partial [Mycotypha africana]|uniref:Tetraspanin family-domain-containing protein n=1 Tax=Mycotypha africana TaxID=64632 RepID=UPI0023003ADF